MKIENDLQRMKRIETQCKAEGKLFCMKCGRIGGLKYTFKDGTTRGITLMKRVVYENKIAVTRYICTDCAKGEK